MMSIQLSENQYLAIDKMDNGRILCGGVGSGKSRTGLAYFRIKECHADATIKDTSIDDAETIFQIDIDQSKIVPKNLYIITTASKRDRKEWEDEFPPFSFSPDISIVIDSWNNIKMYVDVTNSFFIFDEQRVVGSGTWVKAFLKITKSNRWILLTATPGDTWMDYIPVFIANGFYKNRTEFIRRHVVYNRYTKFPKVDHYIENGRLIQLRRSILVNMKYIRPTKQHHERIIVEYDQTLYKYCLKNRWNIYDNEPVKDISGLCYLLRKIVNTDEHRLNKVKELIGEHPKVIIFYNFNYELELLRELGEELETTVAEWNGHKHEPVPTTDNWIYLVQYSAGAEGWNCTSTNAIIFFSQNYSYKTTVQAAGRIDRRNTSYMDLYYYHIRSNSSIDLSIAQALNKKQKFNERSWEVS